MRITNPIRTLLGTGLLYAAGLAVRADQVTFNVDMSSVTNSAGQPAYSRVNASGAFNGWGQDQLFLKEPNIYTNTFEVGGNGNYKYTAVFPSGTSYEGGADHPITLTGSPQTLPLLSFNYDGTLPIDFVTNNITFQVDMRVQGVAFINGGGQVTVSGGFQGWTGGNPLTNNPAAPYPDNWIYSETFPAVTQLMPPGGCKINRFKFRANGGWEEPQTQNCNGSNDRFWDATTDGDKVLPLVFYNDAGACDVLAQDTTVTFVLHLTNGTVGIDGTVWDKNNPEMGVFMNGESLLGFWETWGDTNALARLINNPVGSDYYEYTQIIPQGRPINQKVKYSINGPDNEAPMFEDHVQWIRTTNTTYVMSTVEFGTNYASVRVQPNFGNLAAGTPSGGNVPITWLGCQCVTLQARPSLNSGSWTDWPATDATSSTNVPNTGTAQYFRLQKRPNP
jgi:hypothetical protein